MFSVASRYSVHSKIDCSDVGIELSCVPDAIKNDARILGVRVIIPMKRCHCMETNSFVFCHKNPFRYHTAGDITLIIYLH